MKNSFKTLALATLIMAGTAHAGGGLAVGSIRNLAKGNILAAAIGGGLGAASITHGVRLVQRGRVGWGVFFIILEEQNVINSDDVKVLNNADIATKEAFLEIISSDLTTEEKEAELVALFNN